MRWSGASAPRVRPERACSGCSRCSTTKEAPVNEFYEGQQFVGMDLHRRRSVLVRMTETGEHLETVRIFNDRSTCWRGDGASRRGAGGGAGGDVRVVLGRDALAELGAHVHLAHPLGVKMFSYRRVKNDQRDAADLADLLRMGRLPHAWIAPPATRELRELVRHRAKLVAMRPEPKARCTPCWPGGGVQVPMSDLFGVAGSSCWTTVAAGAGVEGADRVAAAVDRSVRLRDRPVRQARRRPAAHRPRLRRDPADPRRRAGAGGGVRRRDRRHTPFRTARSSWRPGPG